jgi:hypothetical protein
MQDLSADLPRHGVYPDLKSENEITFDDFIPILYHQFQKIFCLLRLTFSPFSFLFFSILYPRQKLSH